jgi:uncharacterized protein (TIGR02001 family)
MTIVLRLVGSLPLLLAASTAPAADVTGTIGAVSDYRYRGLSLSEGKPALQATLDADLGKGGCASFWFSTIRDGRRTQTELEADLGKEFEVASNLSLDLSATYYAYPSDSHGNYAEATAILSTTRGPFTGRLGMGLAPAQSAMRNDAGIRHGNAYYFAGAEFLLPRTPVKLAAQAGYERGAFDEAPRGGKWDWNFGATVEIHTLLLGLTYVDSNVAAQKVVGSAAIQF